LSSNLQLRTLGENYLARLNSTAGLPGQTFFDRDPTKATGWREITDGREITLGVVTARCTRLHEFLAEIPRA
jgi:hypothetical protein